MLGDLLGIVLLLMLGLLTVIVSLTRLSSIAVPLLIAVTVRILALLYNVYIGPLPDSGADALRFESQAMEWAENGFQAALGHFPGPHSFFVSWVISLFYAATDRSLLLAQSLSAIFGVGTVMLGWYLTRQLWGERAAHKAIWLLALFPTLILYSALVMREAYIWFFFLLGLLGVVRWAQGYTKKGIFLGAIGFLSATMFHGAMLIALLAFAFLIGISAMRVFFVRLLSGYFQPLALLVIAIGVVILGSYAAGFFHVPKLGSAEQLTDVVRIVNRAESRGDASYPEWLQPNDFTELVLLTPARTVYFLFSPFPWDVKGPKHLIGLFDGLLYMMLIYMMWRNRREIWRNRGARAIFLVTLPLLIVFAMVIGNFGTGLRHRAKFVTLMIALIAPRFCRRRTIFNNKRE